MGKWDPRNYNVDHAMNDLLVDGSAVDVMFTENGIMREYPDGHITDYVYDDNSKGHNSYDYTQDSSGTWHGDSHDTNE